MVGERFLLVVIELLAFGSQCWVFINSVLRVFAIGHLVAIGCISGRIFGVVILPFVRSIRCFLQSLLLSNHWYLITMIFKESMQLVPYFA